MADLITHLASGLLPGVVLPRHRAVLLALGTVLPDLGGRVPGIVSEVLSGLGGGLPDGIGVALSIVHTPIGVALLAALMARALAPGPERRWGTALLVLGGWLHLAVDLLQRHPGEGHGYALLAPLSTWRVELGWIGSEATVPWAPWLAGFTVAVWAVRLLAERRQATVSPGGGPSEGRSETGPKGG